MPSDDEAEVARELRELRESWRFTELHFAARILISDLSFLLPIYKLVFLWRQFGYDSKLYAWQAMDWLVLSPSKFRGPERDRPSLSIFSDPESDKLIVRYRDKNLDQEFIVDPPTIDYSRSATLESIFGKQLQELIDRLVALPID